MNSAPSDAAVVVGIDAHKRTHTLVAVNTAGRKLGSKTVQATTEGHHSALRWVHTNFGRDVRWGVEDTRAMTLRLERDLMDANQEVLRVPTQLMARTRSSARERGKSDPIDALAVARAVLAHPDLPVARHTPWSREIKLILDHREDLLKQRTAVANRLRWRVHELDPTHALPPKSLVWKKNQQALACWLDARPGVVAELARAEIADIIRLTPQINALERRLAPLVRTAAPKLLEIYGVAVLTAARILAETADIERFKSEAAYARYAGLAPVPHWSGSPRGRQRSYKGGNRTLNSALHQAELVRITTRGPDAERYRRRTEDEKLTHASAMRRLKRRLARVVYRRLRSDHQLMAIRNGLADLERRASDWSLLAPDDLSAKPPARRSSRRPPRGRFARQSPMVALVDLNNKWAKALSGH